MAPSIKAVIFNHNRRESAELLFQQLSSAFDTALFDSGSREDQVCSSTTHLFENLYWTGCWNRAMSLYREYDVVWGIGGDCTLLGSAAEHRMALESAFPFGTWSPAISGRAHEYMKPPVGYPKLFSVKYLEGIAFALSKELRDKIGEFDSVNQIGHGHDLLACFMAREHRLKNFLDARVALSHPPSADYDLSLAKDQMFSFFSRAVGPDWCDTLDWWWGRRISFFSNTVSEVTIEATGHQYHKPFSAA